MKQIGAFLSDQNRIWALLKKAKRPHQEAVSALNRANKLGQDYEDLKGPDALFCCVS